MGNMKKLFRFVRLELLISEDFVFNPQTIDEFKTKIDDTINFLNYELEITNSPIRISEGEYDE